MTLTPWSTRNTRPAASTPAPALEDSERAYAASWGLTPAQWIAATDMERRDMRDRVVYAPYFAAARG